MYVLVISHLSWAPFDINSRQMHLLQLTSHWTLLKLAILLESDINTWVLIDHKSWLESSFIIFVEV